MDSTVVQADASSRLARLLDFLAHDAENLSLLSDAATTALDAGDRATAAQLLERRRKLAPLPAELQNLDGVIAMGEQRFGDAAAIFEDLLGQFPADPGLRFNLAWSKALLGDHAGALALLDDEVAAVAPRAAALKVEMLHHLGQLDEALADGRRLLEQQPDNTALLSALAVAAMDAEDLDLARRYAEQAGPTHEGLSTLGMLALGANDMGQSAELFDKALAVYGDSARALLGRGLCALVQGDAANGARDIDHAAEIFGDHLGSWVTSGWAHLVKGDPAQSRASFERALAIDDTFAEIHGGLAVLDIQDGHIEEARRRVEIAQRLDRRCLSAALAASMLLEIDGDPGRAARIRQIALNLPVGVGGQTIAQAIVAMGVAGLGPKSS